MSIEGKAMEQTWGFDQVIRPLCVKPPPQGMVFHQDGGAGHCRTLTHNRVSPQIYVKYSALLLGLA